MFVSSILWLGKGDLKTKLDGEKLVGDREVSGTLLEDCFMGCKFGADKDSLEKVLGGDKADGGEKIAFAFLFCCSSSLIFSSCATPSPLCGALLCFDFLLEDFPLLLPIIPNPKLPSPPPPPPLSQVWYSCAILAIFHLFFFFYFSPTKNHFIKFDTNPEFRHGYRRNTVLYFDISVAQKPLCLFHISQSICYEKTSNGELGNRTQKPINPQESNTDRNEKFESRNQNPKKLGNRKNIPVLNARLKRERMCEWKKFRIFLDPVDCCLRGNRIRKWCKPHIPCVSVKVKSGRNLKAQWRNTLCSLFCRPNPRSP